MAAKLSVNSLIVSQNDLRNFAQLKEMAAFVRQGGFWTPSVLEHYALQHSLKQSPIIKISRFVDQNDTMMIHDGHHRVISTFMGGRDWLREDEYLITDWKLAQYEELAPQNNWYTPFNPLTHIRIADISEFKNQAKRLYETTDFELFKLWVVSNSHVYCVPRQVTQVSELAERLSK